MMMTAGIVVGSLVGFLSPSFPDDRRHTGELFLIWMAIWTLLSMATSSWAFRQIYAQTLEMWPNGYPG
jgi:hypothetical protein